MARVIWSMHALGRDGLPASVDVGGRRLALEKQIKHDFFAATGFYLDEAGTRVVVKINRTRSFLGLPLRFVGRWLGGREARAYRKLADVPNIPALLGMVGDTGIAHAYVDGEPLHKGMAVPDGFFAELLGVIELLRSRGLAYVDTNKPQNILLGTDGRPHLIDFQISFDAEAWWPPSLGRWLLGIFHRADVYHVLKNKRRFRPDQLTEADRAILERRGFFVRLHRTLTRPYFWLRRPFMRWLKSSGRVADAGSD